VLQRDSSAGERLDQSALDGRQLIGAAEINLYIADKPIERLGCVGAAVEFSAGK